jgi:hypothetical protein
MKKGLISGFLMIAAIAIVIMVIANSDKIPLAYVPIITATATLNFPSTVGGSSSDLTMTLTGAISGDVVIIGVPSGSIVANGCFTGWVSASDVVTIRYTNNDLVTAYDPSSGTFKATIIKQ